MIAVERDSQGLRRVRMDRSKDASCSVMVDGSDTVMLMVTSRYLDGHARTTSTAGSYHKESEVPHEVVPVRSKDVTDFGRLCTAAKSLAVSMSEFGPGDEPSPQQLAVFIDGYKNLQEWRGRVREQMALAEGQIRTVETILGQLLS